MQHEMWLTGLTSLTAFQPNGMRKEARWKVDTISPRSVPGFRTGTSLIAAFRSVRSLPATGQLPEMAQFVYQPLDTAERQIRLLDLLPGSGIVRCQLRH